VLYAPLIQIKNINGSLHLGVQMTIQCLKLSSGEEIVGEITSNPSEFVIKIKNPASIHMVPSSQNGTMGIAILPWLSYAEDHEFTISKETIAVLPFEPSVEFLNRYNQMFGSGIQITNIIPKQ
jgi:hypothetical protein